MGIRSHYSAAAAIFIAIVLYVAACGGASDSPDSNFLTSLQPVADAQLPVLPGLNGSREASITTQVPLDPQQTFSSSGKISTPGEDLLLDSDSGGFAWAMYAYQTEGNPLISLRLTFSYPNGPGAWVGFPNYETGRWDWKPKALLTQQTYQVNTIATRNYVSPQGNLYCLVLSADNADVLITDLLLVADLPPPPTFSISGKVTDPNFGAIQGIDLLLNPGAVQTTTDASGSYSFPGLAAGAYTITPQGAEHDFTPTSINANVVDSNLIGQDFIADPVAQVVTYVADILPMVTGQLGDQYACTDCHAGEFPQNGLDVTDYNDVFSFANKINDRINRTQGSPGFMPRFGTKWTPDMLSTFQAWIDGGKIEQ